jgi:outer membrane lipoprotein-sorting protein
MVFGFGISFGQTGTMDTNDPAATKILDQIKTDYDNLESIKLDFKLTVKLPDEPDEIQEGTMIQQGNLYKVESEYQSVYSDGKTVWMYLVPENEVQIDNASDEQAAMMSPKQLMSFYEKGDFIYFLTGEKAIKGVNYHIIEFKPVDRDSEYSKMRVLVRTKDNQLKEISIFSKDGTSFTLEIENVEKNKKYTQNVFTFESSLYPGIHVEDLRID